MKKITGVTTLTPSFNDKNKVFRLLQSLKKSTYKKLEIIVIDNGSKDGILKEGKRKFSKVKWVDAGSRNIGQTGAYNLGFAHANPRNHIIMIDSDVVVAPDMVSKLVERLESNKKVGLATPMILYLSDKNWVNQAGANVDLWTGKVAIGWGPKKDYMEARRVQNSGTVVAFKREMVNKIGCFEDWFLCYFDPEYCVRGAKAGYEMWYEPRAVCYHDQPKDKSEWGPRVLSRAYLLGRNRTLFMRKHGKNILVYIIFLPVLLGYYLIEALKYGIFLKWVELVRGTVSGFFYPLKSGLKVSIPKIKVSSPK